MPIKLVDPTTSSPDSLTIYQTLLTKKIYYHWSKRDPIGSNSTISFPKIFHQIVWCEKKTFKIRNVDASKKGRISENFLNCWLSSFVFICMFDKRDLSFGGTIFFSDPLAGDLWLVFGHCGWQCSKKMHLNVVPLHSVKISRFFCRSDFAWNQFLKI